MVQFAVALTRADAQRDSLGVFASDSWGTVAYYNWPRFPAAAGEYVIPVDGPSA